MTEYYLDASVLVKRYADEAGSIRIRQITDREAQQRDRALSRFLQECDEHFLLLPVDRSVIDRAVVLTRNHRLRGYDSVQLATALVTLKKAKASYRLR